MANVPISGLAAGAPVSDSDLLPSVQVTGQGPVRIDALQIKNYIGNNLTLTNPTIAGGVINLGGWAATFPPNAGINGQVLTTNGAGTLSWSGNTGTVTSVAISGGTTGITFGGTNPITTSGTFSMAGTLSVANGGTGATTSLVALRNLLPATSPATAGYALFNTGVGGFYWADAGGGGGGGSSSITVGTTTITSGTAGSIPFNNGTVYSEDNANLFWDNTAKQLSVGTNVTETTLPDIQLQVVKDALIAGMTVGLGLGQVATNTAVGNSVLSLNTTGIRNTAVGYQAAYSNTTGSQNTAVGAYALYTNDADRNTGLGFQACSANASGADNTSIGANTLAASSVDSANTAVGSNVFNAFSGGSNNTAVGAFAGQVLQGGTDNTFIGANASGLTNTNVDRNTGVGSRSLENTDSNNNTAVGVESLQSNTANTGGNTAVGYRSLKTCQGSRNTAVGRLAMSFATVAGNENTALGISALGSLTSGNYNTALGKSAGFNITSGSSNTIIGAYDGTAAPIFSSGSNYVVLSDGDGNVPVFWEGLTRNQICNGPVIMQSYTVAGLAGIATPITGMRAYVTDALAPAFLTTVAGGGTVKCPVFYNGTNWVAG